MLLKKIFLICNQHKNWEIYVKFWLSSFFLKMERSGHTGLDFEPGPSC